MNVDYPDDRKCPKSKQHGEEIRPADEEEWNDTLNTRERWSKDQYQALEACRLKSD